MTELTSFYTDIKNILGAYWLIGRQFYLTDPNQEILYTVCRELSRSPLSLLPTEAELIAEIEREKRFLGGVEG